MFLILRLPSTGKFFLTQLTMFNLVVATIKGLTYTESSNELIPSSEVLKPAHPRPLRRKKYIDWHCAILGFRIQ